MGLLLLATQLVMLVLDQLQKRRFGTVLLGTMITPICTGFPNLMIGIFGQERFHGDLILKLNLGNNLANTSLVIGLLLLVAGPLWVRPEKGRSKKAIRAFHDQNLALLFLWIGFAACVVVAHDGLVTSSDGILLIGVYLLYQTIALSRRGTVPGKFKLKLKHALLFLCILAISTWLIQQSLSVLDIVLHRVQTVTQQGRLGLFLGLLTVLPESFLMFRLAKKKGSLGLNGLVGDCLVSIPLVVGISAILVPFKTEAFLSVTDSGARVFLFLIVNMTAITLLAQKKNAVPRKTGLLFIVFYSILWLTT